MGRLFAQSRLSAYADKCQLFVCRLSSRADGLGLKLFRDRLTQIRFVASSFATAVLLFVPGMISKRGSNSTMVEAALAWLQNPHRKSRTDTSCRQRTSGEPRPNLPWAKGPERE